MGKKIKKAVKKVTKVTRKLDPLMGGDTVLDAAGLPSLFGEEQGLATKADREAKLLAQQNAREDSAQASALQAQRDAVANLGTENVADIRTGDAADAAGTESARRRKKRPGALSAQLGINL